MDPRRRYLYILGWHLEDYVHLIAEDPHEGRGGPVEELRAERRLGLQPWLFPVPQIHHGTSLL